MPLILLPVLGAAAVAVLPARRARAAAFLATTIALVLVGFACLVFDWRSGDTFQFGASIEWLPALGLRVSVGVDAVAMMLIVLTALLGPICVAASATAITERQKTYYAWLLVLQAAMTGVFAARDLILFYICFEFTLIPMFILIWLYGSANRRKAAVKFFVYTFTGSIVALAGLVYVAWHAATRGGAAEWTFDIGALEIAARSMPVSAQRWVLLALLLGFAVKVPIFPFHTWLPLAHTEAPTAGSVILAGVLLKLGTYGLFRFVLAFCPVAVVEFAPLLAGAAIVGIVYAGLICWVQRDVKRLVAYSSVAHLGFCVLGLIALNVTGLSGAVLYMVNHGLSTGALFLCIGMIYERYHTRSMNELGGLARRMPVWATFMVFFTLASVGLPGLNGFVSEFLCLLGAFQSYSPWTGPDGLPGATFGPLGPWYAAIAGTGMIVAAIYLLSMLGKVVWGPLIEPHAHAEASDHAADASGGHPPAPLPADLTAREIAVLAPLAAGCLWLGLYPAPALDALERPCTRLVEWVRDAQRYAGRDQRAPSAPAPDAEVPPGSDHSPESVPPEPGDGDAP